MHLDDELNDMAGAPLPDGLVELELVFVDFSHPERITLDCVISEVRSGPTPLTPPGMPIALHVQAAAGSPGRVEFERLLWSDPGLAVMTDIAGSVLLIAVDERVLALELERPR